MVYNESDENFNISQTNLHKTILSAYSEFKLLLLHTPTDLTGMRNDVPYSFFYLPRVYFKGDYFEIRFVALYSSKTNRANGKLKV